MEQQVNPNYSKAIQLIKGAILKSRYRAAALANLNIESPEDEPDERVLESAIVSNIRKFIMSLGKDFSFIGNQYRVIVEEQEYFIDLPHENRSIGIILCKSQKQNIVEYAFRDMTKPMGVATYKVATELPDEYKNILPSAEQLMHLL